MLFAMLKSIMGLFYYSKQWILWLFMMLECSGIIVTVEALGSDWLLYLFRLIFLFIFVDYY